MKWNRATWVGAGVGLLLGMPLFEVLLLTLLVLDGVWFDAAYTIRYFTSSQNVIILLAVIHLFTALVGAVVGTVHHRMGNRQRLRVVSSSK